MTVRELLKYSNIIVNTEDAGTDLDILVCYLLNIPRSKLFFHYDDVVAPEFESTFLSLVKRLQSGEPVQYITGKAPFGDHEFIVTPDVLIPRFDTELLLEKASEYIKSATGSDRSDPFDILDLCTGSGCLAVSIARSFPQINVCASDISEAAIAVARQNAESDVFDSNVVFYAGDLFEPFRSLTGPQRAVFDLIVSNPPYIPSKDIDSLEKTVKDHEPRLALDGGDDGCDFYRRIIKEAKDFIKKGGRLMLEAGIGQASVIESLLSGEGYSDIVIYKDLGGIDRVVSAKV